jgi:hypothetical protein
MDKQTMGRFISRAGAIFVVILFILIVSISACTVAFRESLINVDTYKETLVEQKVYEDIIPYVVPAILKNNQAELNSDESFSIDLNDIDSFMSVDDWRKVSDELIPAEWVQNQTENVLNSIDSIKQGDFSKLQNIVDLSEVVERLQGDSAKRASNIIVESAPDCTAQQLLQLRQFNGQSDSIFPVCNPLEAQKNKSITLISDWFYNVGLVIETQIRQQDDALSIPEEGAKVIYNLFQLDSQLSLLLLLCPLSLIGLIILLVVRNFKSFGRWIGWALILSGIFTLLLIFTSQVPVLASFDEVVAANTDIERFASQIYASFLRSVYTDSSATMLTLAGMMIGLGFILLAMSVVSRSENFVVPEGTVLITEDGRIVSATRPQKKTVILPKDES